MWELDLMLGQLVPVSCGVLSTSITSTWPAWVGMFLHPTSR